MGVCFEGFEHLELRQIWCALTRTSKLRLVPDENVQMSALEGATCSRTEAETQLRFHLVFRVRATGRGQSHLR